MKVLWFLPLTFAGGAEAFALFAPYLILVLSVLYFARRSQSQPRAAAAVVKQNDSSAYLATSLA